MLTKNGGLPALLDRGVVTQCPLCDTDNPDVENRGFCSACGTLFREKIRRRLSIIKAAALLGVFFTLLGAGLALGFDLRGAGLAVYLLGMLPLVYCILANRQLAGFLLVALEMRTAGETQRSLRTTDRVASALIGYFVLALAAAIPLYMYVERPNRRLAAYQLAFQEELPKYAARLPQEAVPPQGVKPYVAGKAVAVEKADGGARISRVHVELPSEIRAESPEEAATLVFIEWRDFRVGKYGSTDILALRVDGDVRVVDLGRNALVARETFEGGAPPVQAPQDGSHGRGAKPIDRIAQYIAALDRQPPSPPSAAPAVETQGQDGDPPASPKPDGAGDAGKAQDGPKPDEAK